ncbi:MAG: hypothetical protein WCI73_00515 [Phycisphaerae bacterium]
MRLAPPYIPACDVDTSVQNTGQEIYQPWWARLGRVSGFYSSSESSATPPTDPTKPNSLYWMFGTILMDSDSAYAVYATLEDYILMECQSGWLSKNKRLYVLVGKSLLLPPEIAIFRSTQTACYSPEHWASPPFRCDIGRGELNSTHFNWGYTSEARVREGLAKSCKVLFDSGSEETPTPSARRRPLRQIKFPISLLLSHQYPEPLTSP